MLLDSDDCFDPLRWASQSAQVDPLLTFVVANRLPRSGLSKREQITRPVDTDSSQRYAARLRLLHSGKW